MATTRGKSLLERVSGFIQKHCLVSGQQKLLVAVSGGPDSVCLLHILVELREELDIELHVAHLDHQLRGDDSRADAAYVYDLAHRLGLPAAIEQRDVKAYQARHHMSLEEAAREVRYNFLGQVAMSIGAGGVAVGHTADDHIETILMHLIRGAGTKGLRGLEPQTEWQNGLTIIRPLLPVSREETISYCASHQLVPRVDASNLSLSPLRNRIRQQLLPLLRSYNPRIAEALRRTARIAADDLAYLDKEIARLRGEIIRRQENAIILDREAFCQLPSALKRHLLRVSVEELRGNLKDIEARHVEEVLTALTKPAGKRISLPGGIVFSIEYDRYLLAHDPAALSPFPVLEGELHLAIPGETWLPGWNIRATIMLPEAMKVDASGYKAYLDADKTGKDLVVRSRRPGDHFQPLGMSQPKKLGEFMIDAKIPHAWRERIPIVCVPQHILWVVGWRIDERAKVDDTTQEVLCLRVERLAK